MRKTIKTENLMTEIRKNVNYAIKCINIDNKELADYINEIM